MNTNIIDENKKNIEESTADNATNTAGEVAGEASEALAKPTTISLVHTLTELVPEDARAENEDIPKDMQEYVKQGLLSPVAGMAHIDNKFNGQIFAQVNVDEKGKRTIPFLQRYEDGSFSPVFVISQADLLTIAMGAQSKNEEMKKDGKKSLKRVMRDYLDKCDGKQILDLSKVIPSLAEVLGKLPVVQSSQELSQAQLYHAVIKVLKDSPTSSYHYARRGGYIRMTDLEVEYIAKELSIKKMILLEQLKQNHLLYQTSSCVGYQAKVPYAKDKDGKIMRGWFYCLYDLEYYSRMKDPTRAESAKELNPPLESELVV